MVSGKYKESKRPGVCPSWHMGSNAIHAFAVPDVQYLRFTQTPSLYSNPIHKSSSGALSGVSFIQGQDRALCTLSREFLSHDESAVLKSVT